MKQQSIEQIINKYNVPVPRYTSYPPANFFDIDYNVDRYIEAIKSSNKEHPSAISFYLHIPYCKRLCYYCGCNAYGAVSPKRIARYVEAMHREIDMVLPMLDKERKISQIHYGGGTPTILDPSVLKELNDHLLEQFDTIENPEIAIECHPGWMVEKDWEALVQAGFNRMSIGVQDFDESVLEGVNRMPAKLPMETIFELLRHHGIRLNMDFIYGLPLQTTDSLKKSITHATELRPERVVTFSYAHMPSIFPRQQVLETLGLPLGKAKEQLYEVAYEILCDAGYKPIGMDHFVLPDDELYEALQTGLLHRNFQGYCTRRTTGQVYAFGVTGISQLSTAYAQNTKNIDEYQSLVEQKILPVKKGYHLTYNQQITRKVIEALMCNYQVSWDTLADDLGISADEIRSATAYSDEQMSEMANDGLIEYDNHKLVVTELGRPFVRNVAASMDPLIKGSGKLFSKPI